MSAVITDAPPPALYAEGTDPEADLVLVCGERKFWVRRSIGRAFPVVAARQDQSSGAEFDVLGYSSEILEKLLLLGEPYGAIALTPKLISEVSSLAHFLGAQPVLTSFYLFLKANEFGKEMQCDVAVAAFALDKLLTEEPEWPGCVLTAMVREINPGNFRSRSQLKERTTLLKGLHASTTMALFQHVTEMFRSASRYSKEQGGPFVEYAIHRTH